MQGPPAPGIITRQLRKGQTPPGCVHGSPCSTGEDVPSQTHSPEAARCTCAPRRFLLSHRDKVRRFLCKRQTTGRLYAVKYSSFRVHSVTDKTRRRARKEDIYTANSVFRSALRSKFSCPEKPKSALQWAIWIRVLSSDRTATNNLLLCGYRELLPIAEWNAPQLRLVVSPVAVRACVNFIVRLLFSLFVGKVPAGCPKRRAN